jgi:hypothetical protein
MIRQPSGNTSADASNPYLLAWLFQDEPDANGVSAATLAAEYKSAKAADPNIPVFTNFSGGYVLDWQGNMTSAQYKADLASTDWVGSDIYPVTGWNDPSALDAPGDSVAKLSQLSGGKPQFAFIETSNQNLAWLPPGTTGVTPGQFTAELWDSLVQGAHGIVYFPQSFNAFSYDSTPPAVAAAMTTQDARIESIGAVLNSTRDPAGLGLKLSSGLVGDYYSYEGKSYFVVVNMTNTTLSNQSITMTGVGSATSAAVQGESRTVAVNNGTLTDSFAPYSVHIYAVG